MWRKENRTVLLVLLLFNRAVVSNFLQLHGLQHTRLPCPSASPRICSNSCPFSQWCHQTISSSVIPFPSFLQSCPASVSFPISQYFTSGGQSIGVSASASVLPRNIQCWFPLGLTDLIFLLSPRDSQESPPAWQLEGISSSVLTLFHCPAITSIHDYWKNHSFDYRAFVGKEMSLLSNTLKLSLIFFQGASVFWFHGCSHHPQWFLSPGK